jgi:hypothetical protein
MNSEQPAESSEKLLQIHRARDEWEGNILVGYLRNRGVQATFRAPPPVPPLDAVENFAGSEKLNGIFVLEHDAERARSVLQEFLTTVTDPGVLAEEAAKKLRLDQQTISELRAALREQRRTFEFLGWIAVALLCATALLWAIWPWWLKPATPAPGFGWVMVILLALAAAFAGNRAARQMK